MVNFDLHPTAPTDRQIDFVDRIANLLGIDFPRSSKDFTKVRYSQFISDHVKDYYEEVVLINSDPDDYFSECERDARTEEY